MLDLTTAVPTVDCSRYSMERHSPECDAGANQGIGLVVVACLVLVAIGYGLWRWKMGEHAGGADEPTRAEQEQYRERLAQEYSRNIESGDPDTLEASRDHGDHDFVPWRVQVGMGLAWVALAAFGVVLLVLIAFFELIQSATG